jgi:hypothetical protein
VVIELRQAAPVEILKVGIGARESKIDVIDDSRIPCAWLAWRINTASLWDNASWDGSLNRSCETVSSTWSTGNKTASCQRRKYWRN